MDQTKQPLERNLVSFYLPAALWNLVGEIEKTIFQVSDAEGMHFKKIKNLIAIVNYKKASFFVLF